MYGMLNDLRITFGTYIFFNFLNYCSAYAVIVLKFEVLIYNAIRIVHCNKQLASTKTSLENHFLRLRVEQNAEAQI